ncbi:MAG: thioesterase [Eubacteriales bacterium]|nr:thioesterase [Eubacteriales bacterium]
MEETYSGIYRMPARIRFSETDEHLNLSLYGLLNYFQDIATFHGEDVGFGMDENRKNGVAWVVADLQMKVFRYPKATEKVIVSTWPKSFKGMIGLREYSIETADGEVLAIASSNWVLMDLEHGIPAKISEEMKSAFGVCPDHCFSEDLGKRRIRISGEGQAAADIRILESHLDANGHMNNAQYVRLAARLLPQNCRVTGLRCEWKKQAFLDDVMHTRVLEQDGKTYIRFLAEDGEVYFVCECTHA